PLFELQVLQHNLHNSRTHAEAARGYLPVSTRLPSVEAKRKKQEIRRMTFRQYNCFTIDTRPYLQSDCRLTRWGRGPGGSMSVRPAKNVVVRPPADPDFEQWL